MKKIIIINDIHGNFEALNTIINYLKNEEIDLFIFTGDLIGMGASSNEVCELVRTIKNKIVVKGNHEDYLLTGHIHQFSCLEYEHHKWQKDHLTKDNYDFINELNNEVRLQIEDFTIYINHYPRINDQVIGIMKENDYQKLMSIFNYPKEDLIIFGHNHYPQIVYETHSFINVGSTGCSNIHPGFTRFGRLIIDKDKFNLDIIELPYNIEKERKKLESLNVPDHEFIERALFKIE